jgi:hypothetical protein
MSLKPDMDPELQKKITDNIHTNVLLLIALGVGALACSYIEMSCWMISGENQTKVCRANLDYLWKWSHLSLEDTRKVLVGYFAPRYVVVRWAPVWGLDISHHKVKELGPSIIWIILMKPFILVTSTWYRKEYPRRWGSLFSIWLHLFLDSWWPTQSVIMCYSLAALVISLTSLLNPRG